MLEATAAGDVQGFFIPYRHAAAVTAGPYPALAPLFAAAEPAMAALVARIAGWAGELAGLDGPPPRPRWGQDWFPRLDGAAAYALVRSRAPGRIVEIGSGHSTRFMAQAIADAGLSTRLTCIDPQPRAALAGLPVEHRRHLLNEADLADLATLARGDVLFVDSSHVAMPGSDVDRLLGDVLPRLARGVIVHLHDILLPDAYPAAWTWRAYNEQLPVACLLLGGAFEILFASHWVASRRPEWLVRAGIDRLPMPAGAIETSLWLRKAAGPLAPTC